jgi:hypothetical protein
MISPPLQFGIIIPQERDDVWGNQKDGKTKKAGNGGMLFQAGKGRIRSSHAEGGLTSFSFHYPSLESNNFILVMIVGSPIP